MSKIISRRLANAVRALAIDAVQKANSGHPGAPMGMADIAEVLWNNYLVHNPKNPNWVNRDRFILSNGHASMLIYSLLHLTGYDVSINDIKNFRQLHSKTPGHPEYGYTPGIDTTTGPLGQGIANAVGMALAERTLANEFNKKDLDIVNHFTYVFLGDGCLMEGISHEACSLAGTLKLNKLIAFWDDNGISIDGKVEEWFADDTPKRFEAYGWNVVANVDGHDAYAINTAIKEARQSDKPTLICCKTQIGFGSPNKANHESSHGAPLGEDEIKLTKEQLKWEFGDFEIPKEIYSAWNAVSKGQESEQSWQKKFDVYQNKYPELGYEFMRRIHSKLPRDFVKSANDYAQSCQKQAEKIATRQASQKTIEAFAEFVPDFFGGSADLTHSNLTNWKSYNKITPQNPKGNYLSYGVREFAMSHIMNGIALHGGFIPFGGTFLIFSDYAKNAIRMSSLMKQRVIYVFTHDSIGLGEDGPTHQPIEQAATLRYIPNMTTWRPCDTLETSVAWQAGIMKTDGPTSLLLSRQGLPCFNRNSKQIMDVAKGGYILQASSKCDLVLLATGSEVELAVNTANKLSNEGVESQVVSMPSPDTFDKQDESYKNSVLPPNIPCVAIEAGISDYWYKYVGKDGAIVGMQTFGESAPGDVLFKEFGFTVDNVYQVAKGLISK